MVFMIYLAEILKMFRNRKGNTNTVLYKPVRFWDVLVWLIIFALILLLLAWLVKGG